MTRVEFINQLRQALTESKVNLGKKSKVRTDFINGLVASVDEFITPKDDVRVVGHEVNRTPGLLQHNGVTQMHKAGSQMADEATGNKVF